MLYLQIFLLKIFTSLSTAHHWTKMFCTCSPFINIFKCLFKWASFTEGGCDGGGDTLSLLDAKNQFLIIRLQGHVGAGWGDVEMLSQTYLCLHPQQLTSHNQFSQHCAILGWPGLNMAEIPKKLCHYLFKLQFIYTTLKQKLRLPKSKT